MIILSDVVKNWFKNMLLTHDRDSSNEFFYENIKADISINFHYYSGHNYAEYTIYVWNKRDSANVTKYIISMNTESEKHISLYRDTIINEEFIR